jgi:hypothetical protein
MINSILAKSLKEKYYGAQDKYLSSEKVKNNYDDFHSNFNNNDYIILGCPKLCCEKICIKKELSEVDEKFFFECKILQKWDFIEDIRLIIKKQKDIEYEFGEFTFLIAGMRINRTYDKEQLNVLNFINRKQIIENEDTIIIPFSLINDILPVVRLYHHPTSICFNIICKKTDVEIGEPYIEIHGKSYGMWRRAIETYNNFFYSDNKIIQNQYTGENTINKGVNNIKLHFNHPIFLIYFYGIDKTKIKNIKLLFNEETVYDSSTNIISPLDNDDKTFIHFSNEFNFDKLYENETVNFSRIQTPILVIDTDQDSGFVNIVGLNYGILRTNSGMAGLSFSK